jgi:hypothetical protein
VKRVETLDERVRQVAPDAATRQLSSLGRVDYADAFTVDVGAPSVHSAEQWGRRILEDAPASMRFRLLSGWSALGLKISVTGGGSPVLGWTIRINKPDFVLLGAESRIGMPGELAIRRDEHAVLFSTFVRHDNAAARALWAAVEPTHVRTVTLILGQASRRARP